MTAKTATPKTDVYERVTAAIVAALKAGTRPWMQPWNAAHVAGPISRPLRCVFQPHSATDSDGIRPSVPTPFGR